MSERYLKNGMLNAKWRYPGRYREFMIKLTLTKYRRNISEKGKFKTNEKHGENTGLEAGKNAI